MSACDLIPPFEKGGLGGILRHLPQPPHAQEENPPPSPPFAKGERPRPPKKRKLLVPPFEKGGLGGISRSKTACTVALAALLATAPQPAATAETPEAAEPRLILISWDGAADWVVDRLLAEKRLPALARLAARGAAAEHSLATLPSKTAVSHAALWTGCWPGCNGVTSNFVTLAHSGEHTLLETQRGFSSRALTAEPLYVTAAKAGKRVVVLSATQSDPATPHLESLRRAGVPPEHFRSFSGFEYEIAPGTLHRAAALRPAADGWGESPRRRGAAFELTARAGETTFHVLAFDDPDDPTDGLDTVLVRQGSRAAEHARAEARLLPRPASTEAVGWSPPLAVRRGELAGNTFFRLFELAADGSRLALYQRAAYALAGVHSTDDLAAYLAAYPGFHDDPFWLYGRGGLGRTLMAGGDGTAEQRLLELVALDTRFVTSGTRFAWRTWRPDLMFHYSPMSDSAGHTWVGVLDPASPSHDPELAAKLWPLYAQVFQILDGWLAAILELAGPETLVALVTDHGMAGTGRRLHLNRVLEEAQLLARNGDGIDLSRTQVLAAEADFYLRVNDRRFPGGIVAPEQREAVLDAAAEALLAVRDPESGEPIVRRVHRAAELAHLGLAEGPGGDLYFELAPGYYPRRGLAPRTVTANPRSWGAGSHGFWPHRREMHAIFYLAGPGVRRGVAIPPVRNVDVAPTLAHLLGIPAPPQAQGRVLEALLAAGDPAVPSSAERAADLMATAAKALRAGDPETAEARFEEASRLVPGSAKPWLGLAEVHERRGELLRALELARHAWGLAPEEPLAALATGRLLARLGAVGEALEALAAARRLDPREPQACRLAALLLRDADRLDEAVALLEDGLASGIETPEVHEELGLLLLTAGDAERALAVAEVARERHPRSGRLALLTGLALAALPERRGEAADHIEAALELGVPDAGRARLELGTLWLEQGRGEDALPMLEEAARLLPGSPEAHYRLAAARRAAGDAAGARAALARFQQLHRERDAADHRAKQLGAALNEAQSLAQQNRLPEALERLAALLAETPAEPAALALQAKVLFSMHRGPQALASIARARQLDPGKVEHHYLEGLFLARLSRWDDAAAALERALALDASSADAHELLGGIAAKRERPEEAARHFQRALDLGADSPSLRLGYAAALESLGRTRESEQQMRAYRRLKGG